MKKYYLLLTIILSVAVGGCGPGAPKELVAKVNNYEITREKFEEEFKDSVYGQADSKESRKAFLDNLINQKLILQDAEGQGYDKEQGFLRMIERFWEQSLLTVALEKKTKEIQRSVAVSDNEIRKLYDALVKEGKTDKPFEVVRTQMQGELTKMRRTQALNDWIVQLRKKAQIQIDDGYLTRGR